MANEDPDDKNVGTCGSVERSNTVLSGDDGRLVGIVDQFGFLLFLHLFDQQAELFLDLIDRVAVVIGNTGLHIQHRGDRIEPIFIRLFFVRNEGLGQFGIATETALNRRRGVDGRLLNAIEAIDAGFHRNPRQERGLPARRDAGPLRPCLGGIGELARGLLA